MIRRFGESVQPGQTYGHRPGAYAVLIRGASILLTFQHEPYPEFQLPGGGIDPGEHPLPALRREVREETGWLIDAPKRIGAYRRFTYMPEYSRWAEKVCAVYLARPVRKISDPVEENHEEYWVSVSEALTILGNEGDRHFLAQLTRG